MIVVELVVVGKYLSILDPQVEQVGPLQVHLLLRNPYHLVGR